MTTPTEQSIRKACEEAGVEDVDHMLWAISVIPDDTRARLLIALARRIEAEAVQVPVAEEVWEKCCLADLYYRPVDSIDPSETPVGIIARALANAAPPKDPTT
jgi:hypothetical protein